VKKGAIDKKSDKTFETKKNASSGNKPYASSALCGTPVTRTGGFTFGEDFSS
jgi:hypothetical protein